MAFPLVIPAAASGAAYVYGRWFSDDDTPKGTAASVGTVALYSLAGIGLFILYKKVKNA